MSQFGFSMSAAGIDAKELARHELGDQIFENLKRQYEQKEQILTAPQMRYHERMVMLSVIDGLWKDHLLSMDHLKEGIGLRGYAQLDPLVAYKRESFDMFEAMMAKFQEDTVRFLFRMQILGPDGKPINVPPLEPRREVPAAPPVASADQPMLLSNGHGGFAEAPQREIPISTRLRRPRLTRSRRNSRARSNASLKRLSAPAAEAALSPLSAARETRLAAMILPLWIGQEVQEVPRSGSVARDIADWAAKVRGAPCPNQGHGAPPAGSINFCSEIRTGDLRRAPDSHSQCHSTPVHSSQFDTAARAAS